MMPVCIIPFFAYETPFLSLIALTSLTESAASRKPPLFQNLESFHGVA